MSDRVFFTLMGLIAAGMIALAVVWPQGLGQRSPAPFGHPVVRPAPPPPPLPAERAARSGGSADDLP